jgi:hypothetical protein
MALEASVLLGGVNEAEWERVGIFAMAYALCRMTVGGGGGGALTHALNIVDKVPPSSLSNPIRVAGSSFLGCWKVYEPFH